MAQKDKADRNKYMREYRKKIKNAIESNEGNDIQIAIKKLMGEGTEIEEKDMLTILQQFAVSGKSAKYFETWWTITHPDKEASQDPIDLLTAYDYIRIGNKVLAGLRNEMQERGGKCPFCGHPIPTVIPTLPKLPTLTEGYESLPVTGKTA